MPAHQLHGQILASNLGGYTRPPLQRPFALPDLSEPLSSDDSELFPRALGEHHHVAYEISLPPFGQYGPHQRLRLCTRRGNDLRQDRAQHAERLRVAHHRWSGLNTFAMLCHHKWTALVNQIDRSFTVLAARIIECVKQPSFGLLGPLSHPGNLLHFTVLNPPCFQGC